MRPLVSAFTKRRYCLPRCAVSALYPLSARHSLTADLDFSVGSDVVGLMLLTIDFSFCRKREAAPSNRFAICGDDCRHPECSSGMEPHPNFG